MRLNCCKRQNVQKWLTLSYVKCIIVYRKCFFETKMNRFTFETLSITHIFRRVFMKANKVLAIVDLINTATADRNNVSG